MCEAEVSDGGVMMPPIDVPPLTPLLSIAIRSAVIGIAQSNGEEWDSVGRVAPALLDQLGRLLGSIGTPYTAIIGALLSFLGSNDFTHYDKPDPFGTASIFVNGRWQPDLVQSLSTENNNVENTFTPIWRGRLSDNNVVWSEVPLTDEIRLRLVVWDEDLSKNDPIGDVEISNRELRAALEAGTTYFVRTAEQSQNQLLFVGISVARQN